MEIGTDEFVSERNGPVNHAVFSCQTSDRRHCLRFGIPNRIAVPRPSGIYRVFRDSRASSGRFSSPVVAPTSKETVSHDNVRSSRARLRLRRRTKKRFPALCPDSKSDGLVVTRHDRFFFFQHDGRRRLAAAVRTPRSENTNARRRLLYYHLSTIHLSSPGPRVRGRRRTNRTYRISRRARTVCFRRKSFRARECPRPRAVTDYIACAIIIYRENGTSRTSIASRGLRTAWPKGRVCRRIVVYTRRGDNDKAFS